MIAVVSHDPAEGVRENLPLAQVPSILKDRNRVVWIDLTAPSKEDMARLTSWLPLHTLALEDCESRHHPKIDEYRGHLVIGTNYIVTCHKQRSRSTEPALESLRKNPRVIAAGPGSVLYSILEHQLDLTFRRRGLFARIDR